MESKEVSKVLQDNTGKSVIVEQTNGCVFPHTVEAGDYVDSEGFVKLGWRREHCNSIKYIGKYTNGARSWPTWGSDPELFFVKDGKVVPSTRVIPPRHGHLVQDGIQVELNPETNSCRQVSGSYIYDAMKELHEIAGFRGVDVSLTVGVDVDSDTFNKLPAEVRRFGCNPTENVHEKSKKITGLRTKFRSGGGHIHMGSGTITRFYEQDKVKLISLMDILCGNTCVLIDRDPANARRRKYYGRAGEHRVKRYGLEYRVPSNFWLRSYTLWSMVTGLLRNAIDLFPEDVTDELLDKIDMRKVRKAINENDYELAMQNFLILKEFIKKHKVYLSGTGLHFANVDYFEDWARSVDPIGEVGGNSFTSSLYQWEEHKYNEEVPGFEWFLEDRVGVERDEDYD